MDATPLPTGLTEPGVRSEAPGRDVGSESASVQAVPANLADLLERHGSDPGADSRVRIRPSLLACVVADLHVGLGMGLALTACILVGPGPHMVWNAFGFGLAAAAAVLALGRPSRANGRSDLLLSALLGVLLAIAGGVGIGHQPLDAGATALVDGGVLMTGLLVVCFGLHHGRGLAARLARVVAPVIPVAAALAVVA